MITRINLNCVASFRTSAALETDKKVNLIYGLNGTGKSTLSHYLQKTTDPRFKDCAVEGLNDNHELLVYNQTFIQETFFESESLKGIFTLSKENKEAATKISNAGKEIAKIETLKEVKSKELESERSTISRKLENVKNTIWKIKTDYTGGDRVLEFCLDGYKGSKDSLFNHIVGLPKPTEKPTKTIDDLKYDLQSISGNNAQKYSLLPLIKFPAQWVESESLLSKEIVGNENSSVALLIKELGNSDWVKAGLKYIPENPNSGYVSCPFCQENTISEILIRNIQDYFDASYESDITNIKSLLDVYLKAQQSIPDRVLYEANPKFESSRKEFELRYSTFCNVVDSNRKLIEDKLRAPSVMIKLEDSTKTLEDLNAVIIKINLLVEEHNKNIDQKVTLMAKIKTSFWLIMRWNYDQTIYSLNTDLEASKIITDQIEVSLKNYATEILEFNAIISEQQKQTVNIEAAIRNINNGLIDLAITDFSIKQHSENLYKIVRGENTDKVFRSLSEGERMIISFLYFLELCRGKKEATETERKKIIVIDDPISSLSHIYVFNVGRLIKDEFFGKKETKNGTTNWNYNYEQVFILTHSLYFFYEITETKHEDRRETQKLFRLTKNDNGSSFVPMNYEEIQNDYQAYWSIVKDEKQPQALVANSMRNIIEYFFNFVEKKDLNNCFLQESLRSIRFQAFQRYMNRESHSLGQNIFDFKEFNYKDFRDAFEEIFKVTGYEDHYKKMIK